MYFMCLYFENRLLVRLVSANSFKLPRQYSIHSFTHYVDLFIVLREIIQMNP